MTPTVICGTAECVNLAVPLPLPMYQVPGIADARVAPPAYCAACGQIMSPVVDEEES